MFGVRYPIVLAPMGGVGTPELAAAVSNAGGLGSLAAAYLTPAQVAAQIGRTRQLTHKPFAVNLFVDEPAPLAKDAAPVLSLLSEFHRELGIAPPAVPDVPAERYADQVAAVLAAEVPVFSFTFGIPDRDTLRAFRAAGTTMAGTATTVVEARALTDAGVDAIALQGAEAGAHRGTFLGRFEDSLVPVAQLVRECAAAVPIPLIASGGIREGREIRAMLNLGAAAVQIGTAFIPCPESAAPEAYKRALLDGPGPPQTVLTRAFSGRPARGIPNRLIREMERMESSILPFPWQNAVTRALRNAAGKAGRTEFLSLWAGEGTGSIRQLPASELVRTLVREAGFEGVAE
jgi:nitronate monooxygenase